MEIRDLYMIAKQENIEVLPFQMPENGSMSLMLPNGSCVIGMDECALDGSRKELVHLAHELGHCITGSFYSRYTAIDCRQRHENRADKWAIQQVIPEEDLNNAVSQGYTEVWDLADYFNVTEEFIRKAVCLYKNGNMAAELYF